MVNLFSLNQGYFDRHESDYQPQCVELTEEYVQEINAGGISSEGLLEQLEDRNDEDYSEYLEVLEETAADPILAQPETIEISDDNSPQLAAQEIVPVNSQDTAQRDIDSYVQEIQSKYRKIRPKRIRSSQSSSPKIHGGTYNILKTNNGNALLDTSTVANPIIVTSPVVASSTSVSIKETANAKNNDIDYEQLYLAPESKSSIELFFASMAQAVKKLPPKAQADIKMNICKIVTEAEVRYSGQSTAQTTQQFIAPPGMIPKLVLIPCNKIDNQNSKD